MGGLGTDGRGVGMLFFFCLLGGWWVIIILWRERVCGVKGGQIRSSRESGKQKGNKANWYSRRPGI